MPTSLVNAYVYMLLKHEPPMQSLVPLLMGDYLLAWLHGRVIKALEAIKLTFEIVVILFVVGSTDNLALADQAQDCCISHHECCQAYEYKEHDVISYVSQNQTSN